MASTTRRGGPLPLFLLAALVALLQSSLLLRAAALPIEGSISIAPGVEPPTTKVRAA